MALTQRQQELIGAYGALEAPKTPYWSLFLEAKRPYLALSDVIRVDEITGGMQKAGVLPRGTTIPPIKVNGHSTVSVRPYIVGASVGISALDTIAQTAGEVVVVNGQQLKAKDYDKTRKIEEIKSSISNTTEEIASRVFITGKAKDLEGGEIDLEFSPVVSKTKGKDEWITVLSGLVEDYYSKNKKYPDKVVVGAKVADGIIKEINSSKSHALTSKVELVEGGLRISLTGFPIEIHTYPSNEIQENTDTKVTLYQKLCLVPVFAGLEYTGTTGSPEMIRSDVMVDEVQANQETGQGKVFGKSAPFPLVILPNLFQRYNFTDLA